MEVSEQIINREKYIFNMLIDREDCIVEFLPSSLTVTKRLNRVYHLMIDSKELLRIIQNKYSDVSLLNSLFKMRLEKPIPVDSLDLDNLSISSLKESTYGDEYIRLKAMIDKVNKDIQKVVKGIEVERGVLETFTCEPGMRRWHESRSSRLSLSF